MECPKCSKQINSALNFCPYCGEKVKTEITPPAPRSIQELEDITSHDAPIVGENNSQSQSTYYVVEDYYAKRFQKIDQNGGNYVFFWNWYAALFSPLWFLVKGMWVKGLIFFVLAFLTSGIATLFIGIYGGSRGTYDLYLAKVKRKQMWFM